MALARAVAVILAAVFCYHDLALAQAPQRLPIAVSVDVSSENEELRNYLTSVISSQLRKLGDVEAVGSVERSDFGVYVNAVSMGSGTFGMSLVVTANFMCGDVPVTDYRQQFVIGGNFENGRVQIERTVAAIDSQILNELRVARRKMSER